MPEILVEFSINDLEIGDLLIDPATPDHAPMRGGGVFDIANGRRINMIKSFDDDFIYLKNIGDGYTTTIGKDWDLKIWYRLLKSNKL